MTIIFFFSWLQASSIQNTVTVACGTATGVLDVHAYLAQERAAPCVMHDSKVITLAEFERRGGRATSKKPLKSVQVVLGENLVQLGEYIRTVTKTDG